MHTALRGRKALLRPPPSSSHPQRSLSLFSLAYLPTQAAFHATPSPFFHTLVPLTLVSFSLSFFFSSTSLFPCAFLSPSFSFHHQPLLPTLPIYLRLLPSFIPYLLLFPILFPSFLIHLILSVSFPAPSFLILHLSQPSSLPFPFSQVISGLLLVTS